MSCDGSLHRARDDTVDRCPPVPIQPAGFSKSTAMGCTGNSTSTLFHIHLRHHQPPEWNCMEGEVRWRGGVTGVTRREQRRRQLLPAQPPRQVVRSKKYIRSTYVARWLVASGVDVLRKRGRAKRTAKKMWIWIHFNLLVVFILRNMSSLRVALRESLESHQQTQLDGLVRGGGDSGTSSGSSSSDSSSDDSHRQATTRVRRARVPAVRPARVPATVVPTQRCQNKILSCIDIHHKRYLDAEKSRALSAGRTWALATCFRAVIRRRRRSADENSMRIERSWSWSTTNWTD